MLDGIFNGDEDELRERIEELQDERDRLQEKLENEKEKRKQAVRDHQEAREEINKLEDKLNGLEGQLKALKENNKDTVEFQEKTTLQQAQKHTLLDWLDSYNGESETAFTAVVHEEPSRKVRNVFGNRRAELIKRAAPCIALTDDTGAVSLAISTPVNPNEQIEKWDYEFVIENEWFSPEGTFAFALARSDTFAYGEYDGTELEGFEKIGTKVEENHSKGGFSQGRFERRRDEQINEHLEKCEKMIEDKDSEYLIVVGDERVVNELNEMADVTATSDVTGNNEEDLKDAFYKFWQPRLYRL